MQSGGWKTEVGGRRGWRWAQHGSDQYYLHTKFPREDGPGRRDFSGGDSNDLSLRLDDYNDFILFAIVDNRVSSSPWNVRPLFKVSKKLCLFSMI